MAQKLDLAHKLEPFSLYSPDHPTPCGVSVPSHPGMQSEKGDSVAFDSAPRNQSQDDCPDGGLRAWLVVLGAFCVAFSVGGCVNSWGVFQEYYQNELLKGTSPSTIAWIGSVQAALQCFPALVSGRLFDLGYFRSTLIVASINLVGFGVGISCGLVYGPVVCVIAHWFNKRRSTALGIVTFAGSIGGTVLPVVFRSLVVKVGFKWTMRVIASMLVLVMGVSILTLQRRLPPTIVSGGLFNTKQFKSPAYTIYTASGFVIYIGFVTLLIFLDASAPSQGVPENVSSYLISIANSANAVGRLASGVLADYLGPINVVAPSTLIAGVLTLIWPYTRGTAALVTVAVTYGASSSAMVALAGAPMMALGDCADVGRRTGMYYTIVSLAIVAGPPISGAINHYTGGYTAVGIFAGSSVVVGTFLLALSKYFVLGRWGGKA